MKYFPILFLFAVIISCKKNQINNTEIDLNISDINIYNNEDINKFIYNFLNNQKDTIDSPLISINNTKFIGNRIEKDSLKFLKSDFLTTQKIFDSLISKEDLKYIQEQINDKKEFFVEQKYFKQKVLNKDSIKKRNLDFQKISKRKIDSLKKTKNIEEIKKNIVKNQYNYYSEIKTRTPIVYINKPLFTKNHQRIIFSFYTYSGPLSAYTEVAIFELQNKRWKKIAVLFDVIS